MRTLYLRRGLLPRAPEICTVLRVSPLFRELVVETVRIGQLRTTNHVHCALRDLIVCQLRNASPLPTFVRLPPGIRERLESLKPTSQTKQILPHSMRCVERSV